MALASLLHSRDLPADGANFFWDLSSRPAEQDRSVPVLPCAGHPPGVAEALSGPPRSAEGGAGLSLAGEEAVQHGQVPPGGRLQEDVLAAAVGVAAGGGQEAEQLAEVGGEHLDVPVDCGRRVDLVDAVVVEV